MSDPLTIDCKYSCAGCGLYRVVVSVPARTTEELFVWMDWVAAKAISEDHARRSPSCTSRTISELMIPITGASKVGGPCENCSRLPVWHTFGAKHKAHCGMGLRVQARVRQQLPFRIQCNRKSHPSHESRGAEKAVCEFQPFGTLSAILKGDVFDSVFSLFNRSGPGAGARDHQQGPLVDSGFAGVYRSAGGRGRSLALECHDGQAGGDRVSPPRYR